MTFILADIHLTPNEIGLGVIGLAVTMIGYHAIIGKYIRDQAGVKETQRTEIAGQPIVIEHATQFVTVAHFTEKFAQIDRRFLSVEHQIASLVEKTDKYIHEFRHEVREELNAVTVAVGENREVALSSVGKTHARIDALASTVGELRGEMRGLNENINRILNSALGGKGGRA